MTEVLVQRTERARGVLVQVLDFSGYQAEALAHMRKELGDAVIGARTLPWAICRTQQGIFAICNEGVGFGPITDEAPLTVEWWAVYGKKPDGGTPIPVFPTCSMTVRPGELENARVKDAVDLAEFIRSFGYRLEQNFWLWHRTLRGD